MKSILSIKDLPINEKKVLMRVDFNTPMDEQGIITDDSRIKASVPSINWILSNGGSLILMSHLGRPKGEASQKYSLKAVAERLSEILDKPVQFLSDCIGEEVKKSVRDLKPGEVILLENLRFYSAEEKPEKDPGFAKQLASFGDVYINDAFGSAHRAHSSVTEVPKYFGKEKGTGFLMEKEIEQLQKLIDNPQKPFIAILGGAKLSTKLGVVEALSKKADKVLIGGAMAFTYLKEKGVSIGDSLFEPNITPFMSDNIILPVDFVCEKHEESNVFSIKEGIPDGYQGVDIGPETLKLFKEEIAKGKTIFWNGPMGKFEDPRFSNGTFGIMNALSKADAYTIIGGGDSLSAAHQSGQSDQIDHLSTGGGASLEFLEFGTLPGIEALKN